MPLCGRGRIENCPEAGESELPYVENEVVCDNTVCPDQDCDWKNNSQDCDNGNFVDADNDGVCDNTVCPDQDCDWKNNGQDCDNGNFVDADNDGVCDNAVCPDQGCDWKNNGQNCDNRNFIDADNDGVCDNAATDRDYGCDWENGSHHHRKQLNAYGNNGNYAAGQGKGCGRGSHHR